MSLTNRLYCVKSTGLYQNIFIYYQLVFATHSQWIIFLGDQRHWGRSVTLGHVVNDPFFLQSLKLLLDLLFKVIWKWSYFHDDGLCTFPKLKGGFQPLDVSKQGFILSQDTHTVRHCETVDQSGFNFSSQFRLSNIGFSPWATNRIALQSYLNFPQ